jgi:hypothetical protein
VGGAPTTAACDWPADSSSAFVAPSHPVLGSSPPLSEVRTPSCSVRAPIAGP